MGGLVHVQTTKTRIGQKPNHVQGRRSWEEEVGARNHWSRESLLGSQGETSLTRQPEYRVLDIFGVP